MKRILLAVTMLVLVLPAMRQAEARADVSIDFFYDNLGTDGSWVEVAEYGYCWQPSVAVSNSNWRPYADGYWAYTDVGWTWVSYEDFGWATYHYGRWTRLRDHGWFWVPGREWGPAWVSWRTGGDYVGWAPLPPRGRGEEYDSRPINERVDVEFDIGPASYNFVDVRSIGEPVLRERIFESNLNVTYISVTVNVTNITYADSTFYNHGPDYDTLSRYSTRPIRRMTLERDANIELSVAVQSKGLTRVQGDKLIVAAPLKFQKPPKPIAPKMVKEKIEKPTFEHGWSGDPKAQADLKQKMKSEDPKNIPPPSVKPRDNAEAAQGPAGASPAAPASGTTPAAAASPAVSANPAATAAPASPAVSPDKAKGKDKRLENPSPMPPVAPVRPAASPVMTPPGKSKKDRGEKPAPAVSPSSATAPGANPALTPNKPNAPSSLATSPDGTPFREAPIPDEVKKDKRTEKAPDMMPPTRQPSAAPIEKAPRKPKDESTATAPNREAPPDTPPKQPKPKISSEPMPPTRQAPPEVPRKQPPVDVPKQRLAPPPAPAANEPAKNEAPPKRGPDKKTTEPVPSPGS
jgi:hypothetical protein